MIVVDENDVMVNHVDVDLNIDDPSKGIDHGSDDKLMVWISRISLGMGKIES